MAARRPRLAPQRYPERPLAWLIAVARNLLASYYRQRRTAQLDSVSPGEVLAAFEDGRAAMSRARRGRGRV